MPPKPDTAALKKAVASALQQARSKEIGFAYLMGKDGGVFETDPRKAPSLLWAAARKIGGGAKGAYGIMGFEGGRLILRCEEAPPGALTKSFKDFLAGLGQGIRFDFLAPGEGEASEAEQAKEEPEIAGDDGPDDIDPAEIFQKARKRPMNAVWLISPEGLVLRAHPRKPIETLYRQAKSDGAQPRGAMGVVNVTGKLITMSCAEAPPGAFVQLAKRWLAAQGLAFKVRIELPSGESFDSEEADAAIASPEGEGAAASPLQDRVMRVGRWLERAKTVLEAKQHAGLQGLFKLAESQKDSEPGKAIKALNVLEGRLAGLNLPEPESEFEPTPATAETAALGPDDMPPLSAPVQPTDPIAAIVQAVTPERKAAMDAWLKDFGEYENGWQLWDDEGGEYVSEALLGKNATLGAMTEAEQVYLAREAARMWRHGDSGENIQEAIDGIGDDPAARRALALGFAASQADTARIHARGTPTIDSPEGAAASVLMMQKAVDLDPGAVIEAFVGAEGELARYVVGVDGDRLSRGRQQGLLDAVGNSAIDPAKADLMTSAIFQATTERDMGDRAYRASLARAMGRVAGGEDSAAAAQKLEQVFAADGAQEMMFGETIPPELRNWALAQAANNPDFTASALAEGWESEVAVKAVAGPIAEKYAARGLDPFPLRTRGQTGALHNSIGQALGIRPSNLPPENETPEARAAREAAGLDHDYYAGDARVAKIAGLVAEAGGDPAQMSVLPVVVTSNEFGVANFTVFRLEREGGPQFVDDMGNKYTDVADWKAYNQLPPGKMTYPAELVPGAALVSPHNTPCVLDSLGEWIGVVGDGVALAAGITVGVIAIAGSGGLATPLVVAGAGAATWQVGRAAGRMHDDYQRGKDLTDLTDPSVRGNWLEAGAGVLSVGAMGAAVRSARLVKEGAKVGQVAARTTAGLQIASDGVDALAMGDQAVMMANNWDRMGNGDRAMGLLNIAFWGGMAAASTKAGGAMMQDALSFTRLRNQAEFGSPFTVQARPDLHEGQMRTAYDLDADGLPVNVRIETGGGAVDPALLALHSNAGRQIEASSGMLARLREVLAAQPNPKPGTQGWEAKLEIQKIDAEGRMLADRLAAEGSSMAPQDRDALLRRQQELAEASEYHMARLQDPAAMGAGWVAAPSEGHKQAEGLGWPTGDDLPAGHHWVGSPDGEPTLRRSDGTVERFAYDPVTRKFEVYSGAAARTTSTVGHGENELTFTKDDSGRTVEATATLRRYHVNAERSAAELAAQREVGARGLADDDAGHMIGHRFNLDQGIDNLFPQNSNFNRGAYKTLENELAGWIAAGGEVRLKVEVDSFIGDRPSEVSVTYEVINPKTGDVVYDRFNAFDNDGNQSFKRVSNEEIQTRMAPGYEKDT